jgi:cytochrome c553
MEGSIYRKIEFSIRCAHNTLLQVVLLFLLLSLPHDAQAGEYHSLHNETLFCDNCHQFSSSKVVDTGEHGFRDNPESDIHQPSNLLTRLGNKVCTSCHDNNPDVSDVVGANKGRSPGIVREAGALNMVGGRYPYNEGNGHTLGIVAPAPGSRPMWMPKDGLMCIDCHDPHGENPNGNAYRNLKAFPGNTPSPGVLVTYSIGSHDPSRDVYVRSRLDYDASNIDFNEPSSNRSAIAEFCQGCHTEFHGSKGEVEVGGETGIAWIRHPSSDADIGWVGERHSSKQIFAGDWIQKDNFVKVTTKTGNWTPNSAQEVVDHSPTCLSCHKAHGNRNSFGLIFMGNTGQITEEGTPGGQYIDLCRQCHVQSILMDQLTLR